MSNSVHRISTGVDLDLSQFTRELGRAASSVQSSMAEMLNGGAIRSSAEQLDRQLDQLMEFARQDDFANGLRRANSMGAATFRELGQGATEAAHTLEVLAAEESRVELRARMMGQGIAGAARQTHMASGNFNMAIGQMSYALEDFVSVYEYMGASGAFRAASNNLTMVARTVFSSAIIGNVVALGVALGPMLWKQFFGASAAADTFSESLDKVLARLDHIQGMDTRSLEHAFRMDDIRSEFVIKPTLDSSDLLAAAESFGLKLKEAFRDNLSLEDDLKHSLEKSDAAILEFSSGFASKFSTALNGMPELGDHTRKQLEDAFNAAYTTYQTRLRMFPEQTAQITQDFAAQVSAIEAEIDALGMSMQTNTDGTLGFQSPLNDAMTTSQMEALSAEVEGLAANEAAISAFQQQQTDLLREQNELEQKLAHSEEERAAIEKRKADLAAAALRKKQEEAQVELNLLASSEERRALLELQQQQLDLIATAQTALGDQFSPEEFAANQDMLAAAMNNLLRGAAEKFGDDLGRTIDNLKEDFSSMNRSVADASSGALSSALRQQQEAAQKQDKNTGILEAIRDAITNNRLVMVPLR